MRKGDVASTLQVVKVEPQLQGCFDNRCWQGNDQGVQSQHPGTATKRTTNKTDNPNETTSFDFKSQFFFIL